MQGARNLRPVSGRRRLSLAEYRSAMDVPVPTPPPSAPFDTRQLALELAQHLQAQQAKRPDTTFRQHWTWWRKMYLRRLASADTFGPRVERYLLPPLGDLTEETLTTEAIDLALNALDGKLSAQTINHIRAHGHGIIEDLRQVSPRPRWTSPNPFAGVRKRDVAAVEPYVPSEAEVARLIAANSPEVQPRFALMLTLGPRYGELRGLKVEDYDAANRRLYLRRSGQRETLKNGEQRSMPLPDWLAPFLDRAAARARSLGSEWLFPGRFGGQLTKNSKPGKLLQRALVRAEICSGYRHWCSKRSCRYQVRAADAGPRHCPEHQRLLRVRGIPRRVRVHDLRHIAITRMQELGVHPRVVSKVVGHGRKGTTDRYTHFSEGFVRAELNKVNWGLASDPGDSSRLPSDRERSTDRKLPPCTGGLEAAMLGAEPAAPPPAGVLVNPRSASSSDGQSIGLLSRSPTPLNSSPGCLLTVRDVAQRLQCDAGTVRAHVHAGRLPARYVGRLIRIEEGDLAAFIATCGPVARGTAPGAGRSILGPTPSELAEAGASASTAPAASTPLRLVWTGKERSGGSFMPVTPRRGEGR